MNDHNEMTLSTDTLARTVDEELAGVAHEYPDTDTSPVSVRRRLNAYRTVFRNNMQIIAHSFDVTKAGIETARLITALTDRFVFHAYRLFVASVGESPGLAVIALGGYGRCELNPYSDIDILCLTAEERQGSYDSRISDMLQFLWDMNFDLGHSTRTTGGCFDAARTDTKFATSLLDARFVTGDAQVWIEHRNRCEVWRNEATGRLLLADKIEERFQRLRAYHNTVQIQEPNIKECPGALRDIHVSRWIVKLSGNGEDIGDFCTAGFCTRRETEEYTGDLDFFLKLRHALHFVNGKRTDLLDHLILPDTARKMGYGGEGIQPIERLMHDYYMRAGRVRRLTDRIVRLTLDELNGTRDQTVCETIEGIVVCETDIRLAPGKAGSLEDEPHLIIALFAAAGKHDLPLSGDTASAVEQTLESGDVDLPGDQSVREEFHRLINQGKGVGKALRLMHEYGVLTKIVPEFDEISWHYQYDYYHTYTTDEHSIRVVENLERMALSGNAGVPELHEIMEDVTAHGALYLAGLLHDVGKKEGRGHAHRGEHLAVRALRRLRYDKRTIELVRFLIREHLLMSHISQRRDTDDEKTIADFIKRIGSAGRLRMLTLLTFADLMALSEGALTEWKKTLLRDLYKKALMLIEKGYEEHVAASRRHDIETIVHALADDFPVVRIIRHLNLLPDQYLRVSSKTSIKRHLNGIDHMQRKGVWASFRRREDITHLTVITRDYPRALSDICGAITASDINIVGARIFTREDGIIIDTFLVTNPEGGDTIPPDTRRDFKENIARVIARETEVKTLIESYRRRWRRRKRNVVFSPPRIRVHNDVSAAYTVVDVFAIDYTGLLYDITSVFASLGVDIHTARIGTDEDQVADAFYIQGPDGGKIEDEAEIEKLKNAIIGRLNEAYG